MNVNDKWFLICNPIANGGKMEKQWPDLQNELSKMSVAYDWIFTTHNNHAISITIEKIKEGYRKFAVVGGDGSINEVINGIYKQSEVAADKILFSLIPLGTANDWSRTHKIPRNIKDSVWLLQNGSICQQDVGLAEFTRNGETIQRYFNNVAGMAYDAFVAKFIEDHGGGNLNKFKYIYYVLYCLFRFKLPGAIVKYDNKQINEKVYTVNIGICKYNGGGLRLVPQAEPNDGKLALTVAKELTKLQVILNMYRFYTGTIGAIKKVMTTNTSEVSVAQDGDEEILLELDGEFVGYAPAKFSIVPTKIKFMGPSNNS